MCQISDRIRDLQFEHQSHTSVHLSRLGTHSSKGSRSPNISNRANDFAIAAAEPS